MPYDNRNSSSRSGSSGIMKDILRGALDVLTEPSSSNSRSSTSRRHEGTSRRDRDRDYSAPRRTATQPEPRRHWDSDEYTGIPSHTYSQNDDPRLPSHSSSNSDELKDMLGKAAVELSRLVSAFEEKLRDRNHGGRIDARPSQFQSDDERFEVLSDSDPETYQHNRSQSFHRHNQHSQGQKHQQQPKSRGLADEYYFPEYLPGQHQPTPAPANAAYTPGPMYPPHNNTPGTHGYMNYQHPQPVSQTYANYYPPSDTRPKPKRSSTSTSQTIKKVGNEILHNLPQLLERAGWLLKILDAQQKRSGGSRSVSGYSGLLIALNLVMELYRQFGGDAESIMHEMNFLSVNVALYYFSWGPVNSRPRDYLLLPEVILRLVEGNGQFYKMQDRERELAIRGCGRSEETGTHVALVCLEGEKLGREFGSWEEMDDLRRVTRRVRRDDKWINVDLAETCFGRIGSI
ncbi:hypothetical protein EV426DRAFT_707552 [Tirmania nivea]|nr:hypothetical protein EV426DRAFT_707552 [Tirmania nivea]